MKAEELMVGDWVLKPSCHILPMGRAEFANGDDWFEDIKPIPLTPEILEKNGFIRQDNVHPYYCDYCHTRDRFTIHNARIWHGHILKSVHELQHALRICGLWELAENFKVD